MREFEYLAPQTLAEALGLAAQDEGSRFLAGGTDLVLALERATAPVRRVIDLKRVAELQGIQRLAGGWRLGALTTMAAVLRDKALRTAYPALAAAAAVVGGPAIRNRATLGGNLCNASPAADTATPLLACGARLELHGPGGRREIGLDEFWLGPGKTVLEPGELLGVVLLPALGPRIGSAFQRLTRTAMDIALVNAAATVSLDGQGRIERAALALGAVGRTAFAVSGLDEELRGQTPTDRVLRGAEVLAREAARPIDDVRASAEYRREMVGVLAGRALREAVRAAVENGAE